MRQRLSVMAIGTTAAFLLVGPGLICLLCQFAQRYAGGVTTIFSFHALTPRRSLRPLYLSASALTTRSVMSMRGLA